MQINQKLRLAPRLLWREWKAGELTVLVLALLVAIASHTAIGHFTDRINRAMTINANHMLGGDLVLSSTNPIQDEVRQQAELLDLQVAETQRFVTVLNAGDDILLVTVKSVSDQYPLKGTLRIAPEMFGVEEVIDHGPPAGSVWVGNRVLQALGLDMGDVITIGEKQFTIDRVLTYEPDRGGNLYSFNPRVMINQQDLAATNIIQPGSRVRFRHMYAGDGDAVSAMADWLDDNLEPDQRVRSLNEDRPGVSESLDKARQYMGLASLVALLLAAVAIAKSGRHYSERHFDTSALLRCFGCRQNDILGIYLIQLVLLALAGAILGNFLGWLAQWLLFAIVSEYLPSNIPGPGWIPLVSGSVLSFIVLLGFTLPSILRLKSVSPQRVLRQDLAPLPFAARAVYGFTAALIILLMWFYTASLVLTLSIVGASVVVMGAVSAIVYGLFQLVEKWLPLLPVTLRAGIRNLLRRRQQALSQTMAFGLTIMAMLVIVLLRTELVGAWNNSIPEDAPNHYVLNIQADNATDYQQFITSRKIAADRLYQVVRGRLTRANGEPMVEQVSKESGGDEALRRELNLTSSASIPKDNKIVEGQWWPDLDSQYDTVQRVVSIEQELAENLSINIGDELTFFTGDRDWKATVVSIRSVEWDNFAPNFYMVFRPGSLDDLPATYINSFYLGPQQKRLLVDMVRQFPSVTVLEMDAILNQVKTIITQVMLAVESILFFVLLAGFVVTLSAIQSTMAERLHEGALVRTLGADRNNLLLSQWSEFAGMGLIAGLIGVLGAEIVVAVVYQRIFDLFYVPTWWAWLAVPVVSALIIGAAGVYNSRRILREPPINILRAT